MNFIRIIKASNDWWKRYYNLKSVDMSDDFNIDYGEPIEEAGLKILKFLEPKAKYFNMLGDMEPAWLVQDKKGKIFPIVVEGYEVKPLEEIDVADAVDLNWEALR